VWTLCEYWIHRVIFHLEPRGPVGRRVHFVIHGVHHDHPNDPLRLVMPPVVSVPAAAVFFVVFLAVPGPPAAYAVAAGFYAGYLAYDMVHFALHRGRPKNRAGRFLHQLHMRHHFEDDTRGFGVSAPYWDTVFGTASTRTKPAAR
jgi:sterol desaturase/sphingolipid hydroxylase (fatty acid hydroxylase superfamily)